MPNRFDMTQPRTRAGFCVILPNLTRVSGS